MIDSFSGEYRWLSNFYPSVVILSDVGSTPVEYASVEHAYQASKTLDPEKRKLFQDITPGQAKRLGGQFNGERKDWHAVSLGLMYGLVYQKFFNDIKLGIKLLATGNQELVEGDTWNDTFWGVCNGISENHLGRILMDVRSELRAIEQAAIDYGALDDEHYYDRPTS